MVKVIDYGSVLKRPKRYYKCGCCHCGATIVFEYGDIWFEEPTQGIGRVECPVCRSKVFMDFWSDNLAIPVMCYPKQADESEYENAYKDTSKRELMRLAEEKKLKDQEVTTNEDNNGQ